MSYIHSIWNGYTEYIICLCVLGIFPSGPSGLSLCHHLAQDLNGEKAMTITVIINMGPLAQHSSSCTERIVSLVSEINSKRFVPHRRRLKFHLYVLVQ